jgi:3-hydroxyisobutyrate dehydrogenase-like beta-hydroxyacid dehydrogenase
MTAVKEVLKIKNYLLATKIQEIIINMSTVAPETSRYLQKSAFQNELNL